MKSSFRFRGTKIALLWGLLVMATGCVSSSMVRVARYPEACKIGVESASYQAFLYWLGGVFIQQGNCAIFPQLSIELGSHYYSKREMIHFDLDVEHGLNGTPYGELYNLALVSGCRPEGVNLFLLKMYENKLNIFGPNKELYPRTVMLKIEDMIQKDPELLKACR